MPKCDNCGKHRGALHRVNPVGETGVFWCEPCLGAPEPTPKGREMTFGKQLELWVAGESVHNDARDECCPDFSCCKPDLLWPKWKRVQFADASIYDDDDTTSRLLAESIEALAAREFPEHDIEVVPGLQGVEMEKRVLGVEGESGILPEPTRTMPAPPMLRPRPTTCRECGNDVVDNINDMVERGNALYLLKVAGDNLAKAVREREGLQEAVDDWEQAKKEAGLK